MCAVGVPGFSHGGERGLSRVLRGGGNGGMNGSGRWSGVQCLAPLENVDTRSSSSLPSNSMVISGGGGGCVGGGSVGGLGLTGP